MANRLEHSSSAYLKSAAHQPIDWHEFGEEAFNLAREQDKPILLDIGAVWCHWCHVIDRESYDNPEIAELINQHYIPVKVDRDQRPDVDARYQQVVQALSGQGGWPLTAFLTYDGRLIYGGTYFPPQAMKALLQQIQQVYKDRKADIFKPDEMLNEEAIHKAQAAGEGETGPAEAISPTQLRGLCKDFLDVVRASIKRAYDPVHGGFGAQPKFPHFSTLEFMIATAFAKNHGQEYLEMLEKTLTDMARGGMYDQVAGGFHRYSVDDHWHVPHFEKMAYDNAEALKVYAQAYRLSGTPFFKEVAEGIIGWVNSTLSDQQHGGFYASQDADIDLSDDGDYFTWSPEELGEILDEQEMEVIRRYYNISERGDMHHAAGRNVLMVSRPLPEIAQELSLPTDDVEGVINRAKEKMLARRLKRPTPFVDQTLYTNWNGMLISAYFEAADLLDLPDVRDFAEKSLRRILNDLYVKGQGVSHASGIEGFLEDYAWLAQAAILAHASTEDAHYLTVAQDITDMMLGKFEDTKLGGFFDTAQKEEALALLKFKRKPAEDSPSSSANAVALQVLGQLAQVTSDEMYHKSLERGLNLLIHLNGNYGLFVSALAVAALRYIQPPLKLLVEGDAAHNLKAAARHVFFPGKLVTYKPDAAESRVLVCVGTQCLAPVTTADELTEEIKSLVTQTAQSAVT